MSEKPWAQTTEAVIDAFDVSPDKGLSAHEVKDRRKRYDANRLKKAEKKSSWLIFIDQFKSLIILLLGAAALLSYFLGQWVDGTAIVGAIVINAIVGFVTELKAVRSMEALQDLGGTKARVILVFPDGMSL